jgi:hypothetical protein
VRGDRCVRVVQNAAFCSSVFVPAVMLTST